MTLVIEQMMKGIHCTSDLKGCSDHSLKWEMVEDMGVN